jgi:hypothetical protein
MKLHYIDQEKCLKIFQTLDGWTTIEDACLLAVGQPHDRQFEGLAGALVKTAQLKALRRGRVTLVSVPRRAKGHKGSSEQNVLHSRGRTSIIARLLLADRTARVIFERQLRQAREFPLVPDGGLVYTSPTSGGQWVLLFEYCTPDNAARLNVLRWKANHYLQVAEERPTYQVLFVLDLAADQLPATVSRLPGHGAFWYIDYATFMRIPPGQHLTAPVYLNGGDGQTYPLRRR